MVKTNIIPTNSLIDIVTSNYGIVLSRTYNTLEDFPDQTGGRWLLIFLIPEDKLYTKIGVYEGAGYSLKGIYRPTTECRMKINEAPRFCPVCIHSLEKLIHFYTE